MGKHMKLALALSILSALFFSVTYFSIVIDASLTSMLRAIAIVLFGAIVGWAIRTIFFDWQRKLK